MLWNQPKMIVNKDQKRNNQVLNVENILNDGKSECVCFFIQNEKKTSGTTPHLQLYTNIYLPLGY